MVEEIQQSTVIGWLNYNVVDPVIHPGSLQNLIHITLEINVKIRHDLDTQLTCVYPTWLIVAV